MQGALDMGHARALLALAPVDQIRLGQEIAARGYSVRQAETLAARAARGAPPPARAPAAKARDLARLEEALSDTLATRVSIVPGRGGRGRVTIDYAGLDQLQGIIDTIRGHREI